MRSIILLALGAGLVAACGSSSVTTWSDFVTHQVPIQNQLMTELSDGSPSLQFDWPKIASDEVKWLDAHKPDTCYERIYTIWHDAVKELAGGSNPGTGDATGRYINQAEEATSAASSACR